METQFNNQTSYNLQQQGAPVVSFKDWLVTLLLLALPIVNLIMLFVWAFGGGANPSKSNFAKAYLIWLVIAIVLSFVFSAVIVSIISAMTSQLGGSM